MKKKGVQSLIQDYKDMLIYHEWIDKILKIYLDKYSQQEYYDEESRSCYIEGYEKKLLNRIYYRKEITLQNNKEIIMFRIYKYTIIGPIQNLTLGLE